MAGLGVCNVFYGGARGRFKIRRIKPDNPVIPVHYVVTRPDGREVNILHGSLKAAAQHAEALNRLFVSGE